MKLNLTSGENLHFNLILIFAKVRFFHFWGDHLLFSTKMFVMVDQVCACELLQKSLTNPSNVTHFQYFL